MNTPFDPQTNTRTVLTYDNTILLGAVVDSWTNGISATF